MAPLDSTLALLSIWILDWMRALPLLAAAHAISRPPLVSPLPVLQKQLLRDYIRVIARSKNGYFLRYFNFHNDEEEEADA